MKHKKLVASEKTRNGKLRHKIRVKSKKTASLEPLKMRVAAEQSGKVQMPMHEIKRKYKLDTCPDNFQQVVDGCKEILQTVHHLKDADYPAFSQLDASQKSQDQP